MTSVSEQQNGHLLFVGDPHGRFHRVFRAARAMEPAAIVLLGDNQPAEEGTLAALNRIASVYYILGNHDPDGVQQGDDGSLYCPTLRRHFDELPPERHLSGRVVRLGGYRVAGLSGIFQGRVWDPVEGQPRYHARGEAMAHPGFRAQRKCRPQWDWPGPEQGPPIELWGAIWPEDYKALWDQRADILVTHEAPECYWQSHHREVARGLELGELARSMGVTTFLHGHHHTAYRATLEGGITVIGLHKAEQTERQRREGEPLKDLADEHGASVL